MIWLKRAIKPRYIVGVLLVGGVVWTLVIIGLMVGVYAYGENDGARPADAIVVLGSGLRRDGRPGDALYRRSVWAAELYHREMAPAVLCTGGVGDGQWRSEADACREVLISRGVPEAAIYLEERSRSTEENAIYTRQFMDVQGWEQVVLVTDSFHMLRAQWLFSQADIEHYRSPVPRERVRRVFYTRHFTREIVALHWQAFTDLFNLPVTRVG